MTGHSGEPTPGNPPSEPVNVSWYPSPARYTEWPPSVTPVPCATAVIPVTHVAPPVLSYYCGPCDAWVDQAHPCRHVHVCPACAVLHFIGRPE